MARPKKIIETEAEESAEEVAEAVEESPAKKDFRELIGKYKIQNPKKYAIKKAALEKKLNAMK